MNWNLPGLYGVLIGVCTFLIIGVFHPIVIKTEYYTGTRYWWVFLVAGIGGTITAFFLPSIFWASLLGVFSFSCFWSILELYEQVERVEKGWFPMNPKRKDEYKHKSDTKVSDTKQ